jgi:hypothetical protein
VFHFPLCSFPYKTLQKPKTRFKHLQVQHISKFLLNISSSTQGCNVQCDRAPKEHKTRISRVNVIYCDFLRSQNVFTCGMKENYIYGRSADNLVNVMWQ